MNLSFAGCGFLGIYHVGVASCFRKYAPHLLLNKISGASAGAIAACCLLLDLPLGETTSDVLRVAIEARKTSLGPFHPSFEVNKMIMEGLEKFLPEDAHVRVSGKLHISLTRCRDGKNVMISQFDTRDELIQALLASAFIPIFSGIFPPKIKGVRYMDGGCSDNLPTLDENTITVSPFCGESDICPRDDSSQLFHINIANTSIELSKHNIYRILRILFPPKPEVLANMCKQGFDDALRFLHRNNLINCTKCLSVQSTFAVSDPFEENLVYDPQCKDCKVHRQEALVSNVPDTVLNVFQDVIDSANKGLLNWVFKHRGMKLLSVLSLPYTLPADMMYATLTKLGLVAIKYSTPLKGRLVFRKSTEFQLYSLFGPEFQTYFFNYTPCHSLILPHTRRTVYESQRRHSDSSVDSYDIVDGDDNDFLMLEGSKDDSTLMATAPQVGNTIWELSKVVLDNMSHILHRVNKQRQQISAKIVCQLAITEYGGNTFDLESRQDLAENKVNLNFTVNLDNCDLPLTQSPERKFKTKKMLKRNPSFTYNKTDTMDDDAFDHILQVTSQQDAVMAYYYLDENNKVKVTEIFDVTDSDSPIVQTPHEQTVNTQLLFDDCFDDNLSQIDESQQTDDLHSENSLEDLLEKDTIFSDPESEWTSPQPYKREHREDELKYVVCEPESVKGDINKSSKSDTRPESDQPSSDLTNRNILTGQHIVSSMTFDGMNC